ncbi:amidase domain-containing protein [Lysinibacter sp. HNR]|uniref:amidase domain-containing protein n=1 Tax=Lysinibacter sp. HNR TaxID=3031408 RepID=UPI002434C5EE|nr:amidase domain-containing protein [Lysinibacter sp. HNR]WGD36993.1 amidase domain-containing protein [Lysinibacter sp. HNR]
MKIKTAIALAFATSITITSVPSIAIANPIPIRIPLALSEEKGDVMGGQALTLSGYHIQDTTEVCFGEKCVTPDSTSPSEVKVVTPPHHGVQGGNANNQVVPDYQKGLVTVKVKYSDGKSSELRNQYEYDALTPRGRQMSYTLAHWNKYDSNRYGNWNAVGGDCANFVSAALFEWLGPEKGARAEWYNKYADWVAANPTKNPFNDPMES